MFDPLNQYVSFSKSIVGKSFILATQSTGRDIGLIENILFIHGCGTSFTIVSTEKEYVCVNEKEQ